MSFYANREYDRAIDQRRKTVELDPTRPLSRVLLAISYLRSGAVREATAALDKVVGPSTELSAMRARVLAAAGDRAASQRLLADLEKRFDTERTSPGMLAGAHLALGDKDATFAWIGRGVEERDQWVRYGLKTDPDWDPIRSDTRYHALLRRMHLE